MNRVNGRKPSNKAASNSNQENLQWNSWWHRWNPLTEQEQNPEKPAENRRHPVREQYNQLKHNKNLGRETGTSEKSAQTTENEKKQAGTLAETEEKGKEHKHAPKKIYGQKNRPIGIIYIYTYIIYTYKYTNTCYELYTHTLEWIAQSSFVFSIGILNADPKIIHKLHQGTVSTYHMYFGMILQYTQ